MLESFKLFIVAFMVFLPLMGYSNTFIGDQREAVNLQTDAPWQSVGQLRLTNEEGKKSACTATLVDDDIILTSAHCLAENGVLNPRSKIVFYTIPYMQKSGNCIPNTAVNIDKTRVWTGGYTDSGVPGDVKNDWALLGLEKKVGAKELCGHIKIINSSIQQIIESTIPIFMLAYDQSFDGLKKMSIERSCKITGEDSFLKVL